MTWLFLCVSKSRFDHWFIICGTLLCGEGLRLKTHYFFKSSYYMLIAILFQNTLIHENNVIQFISVELEVVFLKNNKKVSVINVWVYFWLTIRRKKSLINVNKSIIFLIEKMLFILNEVIWRHLFWFYMTHNYLYLLCNKTNLWLCTLPWNACKVAK